MSGAPGGERERARGTAAPPAPDPGAVHRAHADAWRELALSRPGGAVAELPGVRLACSGLPHPQHNGADVTDPALVDAGAVRAWFAARAVPWAWRVPAGTAWPHGPLVVAQRLMGARAGDLRRAAAPDGVELSTAGPADLDDVVRVDVAAFGGAPEHARAWIGPHLAAERIAVGIARAGGQVVATAYTVRTDSLAGPAVLLAGVGVAPAARRRGIAAALSSWLLADAVAAGAQLAHLQPDDERAARVYARLGFTEVPGLEVRAAAPAGAGPQGGG